MTTDTHPTPALARRRTDPMRTVALAGGLAYLVTFAASIPQLALFADLVADPAGFITTAGSNTAVTTTPSARRIRRLITPPPA